jgi:hypothetical protein
VRHDAGDGWVDLLCAEYSPISQVFYYLNSKSGIAATTFVTRVVFDSRTLSSAADIDGPRAMSLADLDGDGLVDVTLIDDNSKKTFWCVCSLATLRRCGLVFAPWHAPAATLCRACVAGRYHNRGPTASPIFSVTARRTVIVSLPSLIAVAAAQFHGDGRTDLTIVSENTVQWYNNMCGGRAHSLSACAFAEAWVLDCLAYMRVLNYCDVAIHCDVDVLLCAAVTSQ